MSNVKFTDEVLTKAATMLSEGTTLKDTAKHLEVSRDRLSRLLRQRGVVIQNCQRYDIPVDDVINAYLAGESTTALAEKYSSGQSTIRNILKRHGIEMRSAIETKLMKAEKTGKLIYRKNEELYEHPEMLPAEVLASLSPKIRSWFGYPAR